MTAARALGYATYSANRFDASISHATFGPNLSDVADLNVTTARVGTSLAFADGSFGIGRRINDSFMLLSPHKNLGKRSRSEEHTSELQSLMRISYAVFCLKKKKNENDK